MARVVPPSDGLPAARGVGEARPCRRWAVPLGLLLVGLILPPLLAGEGPGFWGAGVCHRIHERSFVADGKVLPLCARCTGIYLGFLTTAATSFLRGRRRPTALPPAGIIVLLFLFLALVGVDGLNSYLSFFPTLPHLYEPHNTLRLLTGTLEGIALASFLLPVLHMSLWERWQETRSIPSLGELGIVVLASGLVSLLAAWTPPFSYYPLTFLSLSGLFLALGAVNTPLVALMARRLGRVTTWCEVVTLFSWGCLLVLLEMAGLAYLRRWLTGSFSFSLTWL